ncbi:hypothetical protein D3C76_1114090 [compost metagenome]
MDAINHFLLYRLDLEARIDFATGIIRKTGDYFYIKSLLDQFSGKYEPLERRFGIKPLGQQQYASCHMP